MSDNTFIGILDRMKARLVTEADRREGTWTADNLQAVANELARIYSEDIENILPQAFVETATGENLDRACSDYGITRREATYAEAVLEVRGEPGEYEGILAYAGDVSFLIQGAFWLQEGIPKSVRAICTQIGSIGNVPAGSITQASTSRITRVTNPEDAYGGYDTEPDDVLRERTLEHIRTPATSGNVAHYIQWAKEVSGVSKVRIFPLARGNGTVDVVIIADGNTAASEKLLQEVAEHIEEVRPIGADVQVLGAEALTIDITVSVVTAKGYTGESVRSSLEPLLAAYCEQVAFQGRIISYLGTVDMIFDCPGVLDVESCEINGGTKSLQMETRQFPVAGQVVVTAREESDVM